MIRRGEPISSAFVADVLARTSIVSVIGDFVPLKKAGQRHEAPCPFHGEKTASFHVQEARGRFHCYGCGADGDAIEFLGRFGLPFRDAVERLAIDAGMMAAGDGAPPPRPRAPIARPNARDVEAENERKRRAALGVWHARTVDAAGTVVETYLRDARGLRLDQIGGVPKCLRLIPALEYWWDAGAGGPPTIIHTGPAMAAAMVGPGYRFQALHLTYLADDGSGKARIVAPDGSPQQSKKMRGPAWGAAIALLRPNGPALGLAEGIESALSVATSAPPLAVWAAGSLGNLVGRGHPTAPRVPHPERKAENGRTFYLETAIPDMAGGGVWLPPECSEPILLQDADSKDPLSASCQYERALVRWTAEGRRPRTARPREGGDFNDYLRRDE